jgi:hypothetical protein
MLESELGALFNQIAESEPAMSRIDPQLAHRQGRSRLRRRLAGVAGTPVLAAAVAVVVALTVGAAPARPTPGPATRLSAPRAFSPLVPYLSFGWLPKGLKLVDGDILPQVVALDGGHKIFGRNEWEVKAYAAGQCHLTAHAKGIACSNAAYGITETFDGRAPDVAGHPAHWSASDLIWQYAPGGWAFLSVPFKVVPRKGPKRTPVLVREAVKIGSNIRYGKATPPLLFPLQLHGLPSAWQVSSVFYVPKGSVLTPLRFALNTGKSDPGADGGLVYQKGLPYLDLDPMKSCYAGKGSKVKIVNGHRVVLTNDGPDRNFGQDLCAVHADGLSLYLVVQGEKNPPMSPLTLFRDHLRLLGADPAEWTPKPIG